ncbi:MAG: DUF4037 domain-containing protein [Clostridia bacterium]|nr:DUF4037 domain-containing protein [Clostridia bacterium]
MKGLELARAYYETYGAPMLHTRFQEYERLIAVGLVGAGSECFGFDDAISRDHDFEPGFCLFLPGEELIDSRTAFALERAYAKLPKEFMGCARLDRPPAGGYRHGVIRTGDFYTERIGRPDAFDAPEEWFAVPESYLAEAVNGTVFRDDLGQFSGVREKLKQMPDDVRFKKLAGHLWMAGQSSPYNYRRCLAHGEATAAQWALYEFVDHALSAAFLISGVYRPFYKWAFRALAGLPALSDLGASFDALLTEGGGGENAARKEEITARVTRRLTEELFNKGWLSAPDRALSFAAFELNDRIKDPNIRNMNLLGGV